MTKRFLSRTCLAAAGIVVLAGLAQAGPVSYQSGDLLLGVRAAGGTGATQTYVVNLGQASQFANLGKGASFSPSVGNLGADLTQIFGANWSSRADVFWSVSGTTGLLSPVGSDPAKTLYATKAESPAGTLATPWNRAVENTQGPAASKMTALGQSYAQTAGAPNQSTSNSPKAVVQNTSDVNNYASYQPGGSTQNAGPQPGISFAYFNPTIEGSFAGGVANSALDLIQLQPGTGPGKTLGTFTFSSDGVLTITGPTPSTHLANIATRLNVGTGDNILFGGFIINGFGPKRVFIRALGPSLPSSVPGRMADPTLSLFDSTGAQIGTNDNWMDNANKQEIIDTQIPPPDAKEGALLVTLNPGAYTAQLSGVGGSTGVGLLEIYDLAQGAPAQLANISTRGLVQTGDNVLIGGTIITGDVPSKIVVRGIGTSLNLPGKLADPTLELFNANGVSLAFNDNWKETQQAAIEQTGLQPTQDKEAAIVIDLPPASYTAIVRGAGGMTGIGVVELYKLAQ